MVNFKLIDLSVTEKCFSINHIFTNKRGKTSCLSGPNCSSFQVKVVNSLTESQVTTQGI